MLLQEPLSSKIMKVGPSISGFSRKERGWDIPADTVLHAQLDELRVADLLWVVWQLSQDLAIRQLRKTDLTEQSDTIRLGCFGENIMAAVPTGSFDACVRHVLSGADDEVNVFPIGGGGTILLLHTLVPGQRMFPAYGQVATVCPLIRLLSIVHFRPVGQTLWQVLRPHGAETGE